MKTPSRSDLNIEAIRNRHLRPEQMEHRTFYEGHIVMEEIERLRNELTRKHEHEV